MLWHHGDTYGGIAAPNRDPLFDVPALQQNQIMDEDCNGEWRGLGLSFGLRISCNAAQAAAEKHEAGKGKPSNHAQTMHDSQQMLEKNERKTTFLRTLSGSQTKLSSFV